MKQPEVSSIDAPLVTVAMVTYNSERYIEEAIRSVLASTYLKFELIISDDNSVDETWKLIADINDERIKATKNQENIGEYANRNACINRALGKYLIFIDGDDILYPHGLEFMVKMMEMFPESGMALSRPGDQRFIYPVELSSHELYQLHFFDKTVLNLSFARNFFRVAALRDIGGLAENYRSGDDYVRLAIAARFPCLLINDGLTWWRRSEGQASQKLMQQDAGLIEQYHMKLAFLRCPDVPLTDQEVQKASITIRIKYASIMLRRFILLNFTGFLRLKNATGFTLKQILQFSLFTKPLRVKIIHQPVLPVLLMRSRE